MKIRNNTLFIFCLIFFVLGCKIKEKIHEEIYVELTMEYEKEIEQVNSKQSASLLHPKLYMDDFDTCFRFIDIGNNMIRSWDFTKNRYIDSFDVALYNHQFIQDYFFMGKDTVMLAFNTVYFNMQHDNAVVIIDRQKQIIDKMSFIGAPVPLETGQLDTIALEKKNFFYSDYHYFPLFYYKGATIASLATYGGGCFCVNNTHPLNIIDNNIYPLGMIYPTSTNTRYKVLNIPLKCAEKNVYYPINFKYVRGVQNKNRLYYAFGSTPVIYAMNLDNLFIDSSVLAFNTVASIKSYTEKYNEFFDYLQSEYLDMVYNPFMEEIYWFARLCVDTNSPAIYQNYPIYSFIIIDKNLQKKGEGFLPVGFSPPIIPYKEGFFAFNRLKSKQERIINYAFFSFSYRKVTSTYFESEQKKRIDNNTLQKQDYLTDITGKTSGTFLILPLHNMCPTCLSKTTKFLQNINDERRLKHDLQIILTSNDKGKLDNFIDTIHIDKFKKLPIYIDSANIIEYYFVEWVNPRLIILDDNGTIKIDKIYIPNKMNQLFIDIAYRKE
ncbi:MAG: hypothetical protein LBG80_12695 [Bacteroidales bacterium]|jgi:hypothetical protein|nr:hypothetical protein [Bacteroidales bacterium]